MSGNWTFDQPTGTYKNHDLSKKLRFAAIAETKFMQFVTPEAGYGKKKGESVTITRVANLDEPTDGRLNELNTIPEDDLTITTIAITVTEWGRSVPYTSLNEDLNVFNVENIIQKKLRDQMNLTMDKAAAGAFKTGLVKFIPTGASSGVFDTDGTASTTALVNLNLYHAEQIRDYMKSTLLIPSYEGEDYMALVNTKAKRGIINDPNFEKWHIYSSPETKFNGEIGRIENTRYIEINNVNALSNSLGSGGVLGEAVYFGADAVAMAVVEDPELRAAMPTDFGRKKSIAWYGILEFGIIWDTANAGEARIVHVTSL
jgi:N4-gp56 family major capsid protein